MLKVATQSLRISKTVGQLSVWMRKKQSCWVASLSKLRFFALLKIVRPFLVAMTNGQAFRVAVGRLLVSRVRLISLTILEILYTFRAILTDIAVSTAEPIGIKPTGLWCKQFHEINFAAESMLTNLTGICSSVSSLTALNVLLWMESTDREF